MAIRRGSPLAARLGTRCPYLLKHQRVERLILRAGSHIFFAQSRQNLFELLLTQPMIGNRLNVVAISPEPAAITLLGASRKMLAPHDIGHFPNRIFPLHAAVLIRDWLFVYE